MDIYWNIFTMHGPMNVKFPNNTNKWQMEFNSAFKGLKLLSDCRIVIIPEVTEQFFEATSRAGTCLHQFIP
jgi:hypothetical protein